MNQSSILKLGNEKLLRPSVRVADPTAPDIKALLARMQHELDLVGGIGLAAHLAGDGGRLGRLSAPALEIRRHGSPARQP